MDSEFVIEKGIEIPEVHRGRPEKYPWAQMEIGDCFFVPENTSKHTTSVAYFAGKRHDMKFSARTVAGGSRIWRVA